MTAAAQQDLGVFGTGLRLGPERVAQLALQRVESLLPAGTWGVWCQHDHRWVASCPGSAGERAAWGALLAVDSPHPWELRIARADKEGQPILGDGTPAATAKAEPEPCYECQGTGDCKHCGDGTCPDCGGTGKEDP